jgi:hypothetical protein
MGEPAGGLILELAKGALSVACALLLACATVGVALWVRRLLNRRYG